MSRKLLLGLAAVGALSISAPSHAVPISLELAIVIDSSGSISDHHLKGITLAAADANAACTTRPWSRAILHCERDWKKLGNDVVRVEAGAVVAKNDDL